MVRVLVAAASVHTAAAACDYLAPRLGPADAVVLLSVAEPDLPARDADDAANVAQARLLEPRLETGTRKGNPADVILTVADEQGVDEIVVGATRGDPVLAGEPPGSTVSAVLESATRPVVVVSP